MSREVDLMAAERLRIQAEYRRRELQLDPFAYAPWRPAEMFAREGRRRLSLKMLCRAGIFPIPCGAQCLEIGYGTIGWLADLINMGFREEDLHGIELDEARSMQARARLPVADLRVGDASKLPWDDKEFNLVVASTVFTSILNEEMRRRVASEVTRVLRPGGALLWYDFAFNNASNPHVRKVCRLELKRLFPALKGEIRRTTLAPPLARMIVPRSWLAASLMEAVPFLRTHLIAVLVKD